MVLIIFYTINKYKKLSKTIEYYSKLLSCSLTIKGFKLTLQNEHIHVIFIRAI